ncbi:hypothetical protein BDF14DRAFT_1782752 [Spinellus fusiger]|nr:hypothetical protein BDF14DRAFT_1782752 [Spinellus fusiger]
MKDTPVIQFLPLTSEESLVCCDENDAILLDDVEYQESIFDILSLAPEESYTEDNHIKTHSHIFFKELGYLTEEPEPIDPTRDYAEEATKLYTSRCHRIHQPHPISSNITLEKHTHGSMVMKRPALPHNESTLNYMIIPHMPISCKAHQLQTNTAAVYV